MFDIIGFIFGIFWLIFLCVLALFLIIKGINKIQHKAESTSFQKIFKILLKSIIPFFFVLFIVGGCSIIYADPKLYVCVAYEKIKGHTTIYNRELYNEVVSLYDSNNEAKLSNGYAVIYDMESFDFFNIAISKGTFYYNDKNNAKHLIYSYSTCTYTEYGLWLKGDEGGGFWLQFKK
ncbi:hypothetical protein [Helicobacter sp. T3_23-1056]